MLTQDSLGQVPSIGFDTCSISAQKAEFCYSFNKTVVTHYAQKVSSRNSQNDHLTIKGCGYYVLRRSSAVYINA